MFAYPLRTAALAAAAAIGLSGCGYNGLYSGVSVGVGNGSYYDPYYDAYGYGYGAGYSRYGYGYGFDPYWGWNDGFYYPGTGYYVYDRYRRPFRWTDAQRRYWELRRQRAIRNGDQVVIRDNWGDFDRNGVRRIDRRRVQQRMSTDQQVQVQRSVDRPVRAERGNRSDRATNGVNRVQRSTVRSERRSETRSSSSRSSDRSDRGRGRGRDGTRED